MGHCRSIWSVPNIFKSWPIGMPFAPKPRPPGGAAARIPYIHQATELGDPYSPKSHHKQSNSCLTQRLPHFSITHWQPLVSRAWKTAHTYRESPRTIYFSTIIFNGRRVLSRQCASDPTTARRVPRPNLATCFLRPAVLVGGVPAPAPSYVKSSQCLFSRIPVAFLFCDQTPALV